LIASKVALPVAVADVLKMGKHAIYTLDKMERFARSFVTVWTFFHSMDARDTPNSSF
jgi:hypothetical protein